MKIIYLSLAAILAASASYAEVKVGDSVTYRYSDGHSETKTVTKVDTENAEFAYSWEELGGKDSDGKGQILQAEYMDKVLEDCAATWLLPNAGKKVDLITDAGEFKGACHYVVKTASSIMEVYYSKEVPWHLIKASTLTASGETGIEVEKFTKH